MVLAWSLFNLAVLLLFLHACWRVGRFLKGQLGTTTTLLFMLGLLFLIWRQPQPAAGPAKNLLARAQPAVPFANGGATAHQPLDATHDLIVRAEYQRDDQAITPRGLYASVSGFLLGHSWSPQDGILYAQNGNTLTI